MKNIIPEQDTARIKARQEVLDNLLSGVENCPKCIEEKRKEKHLISKKHKIGCPIHN